MNQATEHVQSDATPEAEEALQGRTRTCVGCGERVAVLGPGGADFVRLILGPGGEIAVDSKGGGFGRGAHVHARRACVERAARAGLLRATKGAAHLVLEGGESDKGAPLSAESLARAIQRSMDRRIEGLLGAAGRSRQVARGADAVTSACHRGEGHLVVVACDAAAAADVGEVRHAVAEGRAVAWGTKERLGAVVAPSAVRGRLGSPHTKYTSEGVGVVAITSRKLAEGLRQAVQAANAVTPVAMGGARGPSQTLLGDDGGRAPKPRNEPRPKRGPVTGESRSDGRVVKTPAGPRGAMRAGDRRNDG